MKLTQIKANGFKSFRESTTIQFSDGMTGIVGPNGCGKSNIVDAISWVLGTTAASQVRGEQMEDMIFAGTTKHSPSSFAEVSITFEKDDDDVWPTGFERLSQLEFKRRLERGGDGQYFINSEPCLLRNIQEMLQEIGTSNWSIIKQDTISNLISSKPEQLRDVIEQVAGTMVFKNKKRLAENKLKLTLQNIEKIVAILNEQKKHLKKLEKQASQAQVYKELKDQIRDIELTLLKKNYISIIQSVEESTGKIKQALKEEEIYRKELEQCNEDYRETKNDSDQIYRNLDVKRVQLREFSNKVNQKEIQLGRLKAMIDSGSDGNLHLSTNVSEFKDFQQRKTQEVQELQDHIKKDQSVALSIQDNLDRKKDDLDKLQLQTSLLQKKSLEDNESKSDLVKQSFQMEESVKSSGYRKNRAQDQLKDLNNEFKEKEKQSIEFSKQYKKLSQELEKEEAVYLNLQEEIRCLKENSSELFSLITTKKEQIESATIQQVEMNSKIKSLLFLKDQDQSSKKRDEWLKNNTPLQTLFDVIKVESSYEVAAESFLHHHLQSFLTKDSKEICQILDTMKQSSFDKTYFLFHQSKVSDISLIKSQLNSVQKEKGFLDLLQNKITYSIPTTTNSSNPSEISKMSSSDIQECAKSILRSCVLVDSIQTMSKLYSKYPNLSFVTLEGHLLEDGRGTFGGQELGKESNPFIREKEINTLKSGLEEVSHQMSTLSTEVTGNKSKKEKIDQELERLQGLGDENHQQLTAKKQEQALVKDKINYLNTDINEYSQKKQVLNNELEQLDHSTSASTVNVEKVREQIISMESVCTSADKQLQECIQKKDSIKENTESLMLALMSIKKDISHKEDQIRILTASINEMAKKENEFYQKSTKSKESLEAYAVELSQIQSELQPMKDKYQKQLQEQEEHEKLYEKKIKEHEDLGQKLAELNSKIESLSESKHQWQVAHETLEVERKNLEEKTMEAYQMELTANLTVQKAFYTEEEESVFNNKTLQQFKDKLGQIGQVNLIALEEFEELNSEYQTLEAQYNDLDQSRNNLQKVIDEMDQISAEKFNAVFKQVNEKFSQVFSSVFDGGTASLVLVDTKDDSSNKGVEIMACPPSKRLKSLKLLSGGEKSLTALSLVFSIFLVRLSPFIILDEVDAALDDSNVFRFNSLVKSMAEKCQIIMITHNKFSMKECDRLYGVTMQEKGVTQLVTVDLSESSSSKRELSL